MIQFTNTSIVINKIIHSNGTKQFTIIKDIKNYNCTCLCNCVPHAKLPNIEQFPVPSISFEKQNSTKNNKCNLSKYKNIKLYKL